MKKIYLLFIFLITFLSGCAVMNEYSDLQRTWYYGKIFVPEFQNTKINTFLIKDLDKSNNISDRKLPLVLYLHGCTGLGNFDLLNKIAGEGFVVIAPDSFARKFRPLQCDPINKTGGRNLFVYDFRSAEITYALEKIGDLSWIDFNNLFIFGVSEGAVATSLFRGSVFNGRIITQWTCKGAPLIEGIDAPINEPILSIIREGDPYYISSNTKDQSGNCSDYFNGRPNSSSIILPTQTGDLAHDVLTDKKVFNVIKSFLNMQRR